MPARLIKYWSKRDFAKTKEPRGKTSGSRKDVKTARAQGGRFVIQKHDATRLHYDLRLELDGIMLSWAITKGPSLVPTEKRLAIHVEDHPVEYNSFEGTIPKGEYGGGTVMIWDRGRWAPQYDPHKGLKKGHLEFELTGKKLHGLWHLVRMRKREGERQEPWLLIKSDDEFARTPSEPDILDDEPDSVATRRSIKQIAEGRSRVWHSNRSAKDQPDATRKKAAAAKRPGANAKTKRRATSKTKTTKPRQTAKKKQAAKKHPARSKSRKRKPAFDLAAVAGARKQKLPDFVAPSLATLQATAPSTGDWIHEIKFDGYRLQARIADGRVKLLTRNGLDWSHKFPSIAGALEKFGADTALLDGEVVSLNDSGTPDFSALQDDITSGREDRMVYYLFDLLHVNGYGLTDAALIDRKAVLEQLCKTLPAGSPVKFSETFTDGGPLLLKHACQLQLEGIISKRPDARYRSGRSGDWIKTKCANRQEFVIAGFEASDHARSLRSLILAYEDDGTLRYAGRAGTGFTERSGRELRKRLDGLHIAKMPFAKMPEAERKRSVHWVKPQLVAEVEFRGWTGGDVLRQASFKGLRDDKPAQDVVREAGPTATQAQTKRAAMAQTVAKKTGKPRAAPTAKRGKTAASAPHLTHPDRVYWKDASVTKQDLADYYLKVWDWIAPHLVGRPLSLLRCPEGAGGECFFQKHSSAGLDATKLKIIKSGGDELMALGDRDGLIALVQAGVLEIHVWGTTLDGAEQCDRLVFDLDPGPGLAFKNTVEAAREVRQRLADAGLESFVKTSGGKGLHVVVPIAPADWDAAKDFSHQIALDMARANPDRYTANMAKNRRNKRIFVDYLRNGRGATAIAPYSTRARPGAAVSVPVHWSDLAKLKAPDTYTVNNVMQRLGKQKADPWQNIGRLKQKLPGVAKRR